MNEEKKEKKCDLFEEKIVYYKGCRNGVFSKIGYFSTFCRKRDFLRQGSRENALQKKSDTSKFIFYYDG